MSKIPEIRINFAYLLFGTESKKLAGDNKLQSFEQYEKWTDAYRKEWKKYEEKIVSAMQKMLDVNFYKSIIDVSCAPFFIPKSEPLIMNFMNKPDQFVDVLMHELCHVLLTDNNKLQINSEKPIFSLIERWKKLFGKDHGFNTLVHIPVHAMSKYIYLDVLEDSSRLERDIESIKKYHNSAPYTEAWDYVNAHDYKQIISDLKQSYAEAKA